MRLIVTWGSSGAGKTTVSLALAAALAARHRDVLVLSSDTRTPALPVMLPTVKDLDERNSAGPLFTMEDISEAALKNRLVRHPRSSRIFCMGLASGEATSMRYGTPVRDSVIALFHLLHQTPFHYVIVDGDSFPLYDQTTLAAMEYANAALAVLTPDVKGYEFWKAQRSWLDNSDIFRIGRFIRLASPVFPYTPLSDARAVFGGFDYELPHAPEVAERMMAGELLSGFSTSAALRWEAQLRLLTDRIEREEIVNDGK